MRSSLLFEIAAGLLVFFGVTHTLGLFDSRSRGAAADAVRASMRSVHFSVMGSQRSRWDFYAGSGLLLTLFLLYSAVLAWQLGSVSEEDHKVARHIAWLFAISQIAVAVLSWTNFFLAPLVVSTVIASLLLLAAWQSGRGR